MKLGLPVDPVLGTWLSQGWMERPEVYSRFGLRGHNAADVAFAQGHLVVAVAEGIVERIAWDPHGYGYWVQVQHAGFYTRYCHGIRDSAMVGIGELILKGTPLFRGDSTGFSTGPHLHFEIRTTNRQVIDMLQGADGRWYMSDGGNYVLDPRLFLPAPYGEGREIGGTVNDEVLRLEADLKVTRAELKVTQDDRDRNKADKFDLLPDIAAAIWVLNTIPDAILSTEALAQRTALNRKYAGRITAAPRPLEQF